MSNTTSEQAQAAIANIAAIEVVEIKGGFQYIAINKDGSRTVIRKKATRRYENAFVYDKPPGSAGNDRNALHNWFTFGKNPTNYTFVKEVARLSIQGPQ